QTSLENGQGFAGAVKGASQSRGSNAGGSAMFGGLRGALRGHLEWASGEPVALYGKAPQGAAEVAVTHADGTVTTVPVVDGWWLAVFAADAEPASRTGLEARSASGASLGAAPIRYAEPGSDGFGQSSLGG